MPRILLLLLTLCLAACGMPKVDPAREAQADRAYELVRRNDVVGLTAATTPASRAQDLTGPMRDLQAEVHASSPTKAETLSWASETVNDVGRYRVVRLYSHPEGDVQVDVLMARQGEGPWQVDGLRALRVTAAAVQAREEQVAAARFTFAGKGPAHYIVLIGAGLSFVLCVGTAVVAGLRRRWFWMLGSLFGVCQVTLNWTTGAFFFQPLYFVLLGAGFLKGMGPADPWLISLGLPVPALLFWGLGKWRKKTPKTKAKADRPEPDFGTPDA